MNDIEQKAKDQFEKDAAEEYVEAVSKLVEDGKAAWIEDPYVDNVVGLLHASDGVVHPTEGRAYLVVYLPGSHPDGKFGDFETSDELDELVYGGGK